MQDSDNITHGNLKFASEEAKTLFLASRARKPSAQWNFPLWARWLAVFAGPISVLTYCDSLRTEEPMASRYPGPWSSEVNLPLYIALAKAHKTGCGQLSYRAAVGAPQEYLVYCTRDGKQWTAYLVWTASGDVMGPLKPDATLPLPP